MSCPGMQPSDSLTNSGFQLFYPAPSNGDIIKSRIRRRSSLLSRFSCRKIEFEMGWTWMVGALFIDKNSTCDRRQRVLQPPWDGSSTIRLWLKEQTWNLFGDLLKLQG